MSLTHSTSLRLATNRTFIVSVVVLAVFAVIQILAVLARYLPALRDQLVASATAEAPTAEAVADPLAGGNAQSSAPAQPAPNVPPAANLQEAARLFNQASAKFRVGEFDEALELLDQLDVLVPGDPRALMLRVEVLVTAGRSAEAVLALEELMKVQDLPPDVRTWAQRRLDQLANALSSGAIGSAIPQARRETGSPAATGGEGLDMRDDVGLQPGAMLGIVSAKLMENSPGKQTLRVALKARPGQAIDTQDMKVQVFFYEQDETGEVLPTSSKVTWQWISQPVDWSEGEPEILDLEYVLPDSNLPGSAAANGAPGRTFYGYVVGVYYNNELQDSRAEPGKLGRDFELPLYLKAGDQ